MENDPNKPKESTDKKSDYNIEGEVAEGIILGILYKNGFVSRVRRLGDKWPRIDIYGEFEENGKVYFFFFQVKSTSDGFTAGGKLNVEISKEDLNEISRFKAPTYLIGLDLHDIKPIVQSFIITVRGEYTQGFAVMNSNQDNEANAANFAKLKKEIIDFWDNTSNDYKLAYSTSFELKR